jgi:hypothetical protein
LQWIQSENTKSATFNTTIDVTLDTTEKQQIFNSDPFIYAIILHRKPIDEGKYIFIIIFLLYYY